MVLVGVAQEAQPGETALLPPFRHFALRSPEYPPPPGLPDLYAATGSEPDWQIVQWNIPGERLAPFFEDRVGNHLVLKALSPEATVQIIQKENRRTVELAQDGAVLPCNDAHGAPRESDLFLQPNYSEFGENGRRKKTVRLSELRSLILTATVSIRYRMIDRPKGCVVNQGNAIIAVVLNNLTQNPTQTLFYQLGLNQPCGLGPGPRMRLCEAGTRVPHFFAIRNPFGLDDSLPLLGLPYVTGERPRSIVIDLLPRVRQLIVSGPAKMDRNPSHWVVNSAYAGQHILGDFRLSSIWDQFQIEAVPNEGRPDAN